MATPVIMPRQGQSVESCIISKWHKKKGDTVKAGDILFTYETDKSTFDEEAKLDGTILEIFFEEDDEVPVLTNVCVIGNEGESVDEFRPEGQQNAEEETQAKPEVKAEEAQAPAQAADVAPTAESAVGSDGRIKISPRAKNLAQKANVDFLRAEPTGPNGRIIERDIIEAREKGLIVTPSARDEYMRSGMGAVSGTGIGGRVTTGDLAAVSAEGTVPVAASAAVPQEDFVDVKLTNIRKVIAKSMHQSLSNSAQLTLNTTFDATDILAFRKKIKESMERLELANITLNDIVLYAVSRTILNHKNINAHYLDDKMRIFNNAHLGIAVDTERGLMVPTLFNANMKSLNDISREAKALAGACQEGTISPDSLKGASFTVTNLGSMGVESFTPVINPPQAGILGVDTIVQKVREVKGEYQFYPAMGLSLTFDHRAIDGAPAARFLKDLKNNLENFSVLLAK